jgi:hypothetical protein
VFHSVKPVLQMTFRASRCAFMRGLKAKSERRQDERDGRKDGMRARAADNLVVTDTGRLGYYQYK